MNSQPKATVLVTGNHGYIGTVLVRMLVERGYAVVGLDTGYYEDCILGERTGPLEVRTVRRDIRKVEKADIEGVDGIIHLAALSNDPTGELNPGLTHQINTEGSDRLSDIAKEVGIERFVFASSCSIYGQNEEDALTEEAEFNPQTAYAKSKVDTEALLVKKAGAGFSPVYMRNATAYGFSSRLRFDIAINNLTGWGCTTGQVKLMSDGKAWRPMVHIEDISSAAIAALEADRDSVHNQAFNVGSETENYQIRTIAEMVAESVPGCEVTFAENVSADNRTYNVSFEKIRQHLPGFTTQWSVKKGIEQLRDKFKEVGLTEEMFLGRNFTRLKQLNYLIEGKSVDDELHWL